jgi:phasin
MDSNSGPNFQIPEEMRAFAEKSVEQAKQAFDSFISAAQHAANTMENQATSARSGAKEVGDMAMRFAEHNVATSFEFASKMVHAKDAQEMMALHREYVSSQMNTLAEQAKELGKQATKMTGRGPAS